MKLTKQLTELSPDTVVKIGSEKGSSWWYVGTVEDFNRYADYYDDAILNRWQSVYKNATKKLTKAVDEAPTWSAYLNKEIAKKGFEGVDYSYSAFLKHCDAYTRNLKKLERLRKRYQTILESYEHIHDRQVVRCAKSDPTMDDTINIVVTGYETGAVWTSDDCESRGLQLK